MDLVDVPDVVVMALIKRPPSDRFLDQVAGHPVTLTGQDSVAVHNLIAASFKFLGHGGLARAGDSVDEVVALAHGPDGIAAPLREPPEVAAACHCSAGGVS